MMATRAHTGRAAPPLWAPARGPSSAAANRPAHRSGRVIRSGSSWWSMSMPVSAINAQVTGSAQAAAVPKPKCHATQAERIPVAISTTGYRGEILVRQEAQRPRRITQLITGMFCHALIGALHEGQAEPGVL